MLKRISCNQLFEFLQINNTLADNQVDFRKLYSTVTSLIGPTDYWYENIDRSKITFTLVSMTILRMPRYEQAQRHRNEILNHYFDRKT